MHTTAEKRHNDWKKAIRKCRLDRELDASNRNHKDIYPHLHQYSKNKIHCSCPLCNPKTAKTKKPYGHGGRSGKNWSPNDQRKIEDMKEQSQEFDNE